MAKQRQCRRLMSLASVTPVALLSALCAAGSSNDPALSFAAGERAGESADVQIVVGTDLPRRQWDLLALYAEARGRGKLVVGDGALLSGRIVTEGIHVLPGARVYIEAGTHIISTGENRFDGTLVPIAAEASDERAWSGVDEPDRDDDPVMLALGAPPSSVCPALTVQAGANGVKPATIEISFVQNTIITGEFSNVCAGPGLIQLPEPGTVTVLGAKSARATGGKGGDGIDIVIEGIGLANLTIAGQMCNGQGADGAAAMAIGDIGDPCDCGGDAFAIGGNGGNAGNLTVVANSITWVVGGSLLIYPGGEGGYAAAFGGSGGDCDDCGSTGGRGGNAKAVGGHAGRTARIFVGGFTMSPPPAVVLNNLVTFAATPPGGAADALAGFGGKGGSCIDCGGNGGPGGNAGKASAVGGNGAAGMLLHARQGGSITAFKGSDGGNGGDASASAFKGGDGGEVVDCPCPFPFPAGNGGDGGAGGDAVAQGGNGGSARKGNVAALVTPTSGNGGNAAAACGNGGDGADGANCVDGEPEFCMHGFGGAGGPGGSRHAVGGKPGTVQGGAAMGTPGAPPPPIGANGTCDNGEDGLPGVQMCPTGGSCCLPGDGPGCADGRCAALVCEIDHFCCEVLWDQICADLANQLCPSCGGGASNCCSANGGIGCDDSRCQNIVCSLNPLCCQVAWDQICADLAQQLCPICGSQ